VKVIVGLGNPGAQYERTRHNAGFMVLNRLVERHAPGVTPRARFHALAVEAALPDAGKCLLLKPTTYMNQSGQCVAEAVRFYKVCVERDLLVIVDDVALPCGTIRLREQGGTGGHNGLADIQQRLGSDVFARLRVGIDGPGAIPQVDYVLGRFTQEQWDDTAPALDQAVEATCMWAARGATTAMNRFNKQKPSQANDAPEDVNDATQSRRIAQRAKSADEEEPSR